jgi:hypothetical protein
MAGFLDWLRFFLHIETLFFIGIVILLIYVRFFRKSNKSTFLQLEEIAGMLVTSEGEPKRPQKREKRVNKHEERCREIFENIFKKEFISTRPGWLKNPATGKSLELDGYNPDIVTPIGRGLAFEYDGIQHSQFTPAFHNSLADLKYQRSKDAWKDAACKDKGVMLIRIPNFVAYSDLDRWIRQSLSRAGMRRYL